MTVLRQRYEMGGKLASGSLSEYLNM